MTWAYLSRLLLLWVILTLMSCQKPFKVSSQPTRNFPLTWSQRLDKEQQEIVNQFPKNIVTTKIKSPIDIGTKPQVSAPKFQGEVERIAVLELHNRVPQQVSRDEITYLSNELRTVASYLPSSKYIVLTKESLEVLIDPSMKLEECVGSCAVETGRLIGATWILTGEVVRFGQSLRVSLKVHHTKTGQFLKGVSIKGTTVEDLETKLHAETLALIKEVSPKWGKWLHQIAPNNLAEQLQYLRTTTTH